jgi:neutral amino acid transport system permease protein
MVGYLLFLTISSGLFAISALGLNLQWGIAGLVNFGHVAFTIVGAYTTVLLSAQGVPIFLAVAAGAILAASLGLLVGMSTLRLREDYLAIVTIGVAELLRSIALNEEWLTKGSFGVQTYPLPFGNWQPNAAQEAILIAIFSLVAIFATWQLWRSLKKQWRESQTIQNKSYQPRQPIAITIWGIIALALLLLVYINGTIALSNYNYKAGLMLLVLIALALIYAGLEVLLQSPWGRVLKAIREDEEVAKALGKNVFWYKLQAFMLGGSIAGIAGSFYAWNLTTVYPSNFESLITFNIWTMVAIGGAANNAGTILGAIIFFAYESLTRFLPAKIALGTWIIAIDSDRLGAFRIMIVGLILMLLMLWRPQGLLGKKEELTLGR